LRPGAAVVNNVEMGKTRRANQLRPVDIQRYPPGGGAVPGSVIITQGDTRILCTASIAEEVPKWMATANATTTETSGGGWVTAEYAMLPGSTPERQRRGITSRATEIRRLIGRVLRAGVDLQKMPGITVTCDCDVIVADGGTRTAAITGAFVALADALTHARRQGLIETNPIHGPVAAVSVGLVDDKPYLDLDYDLDARAQVDMNVAMNHRGELIEVQATAEGRTFSHDEMNALLDLAWKGIRKLMRMQRQLLRAE